VLPEIVKRGIVPDVLTDQTSAHDALTLRAPRMSLEHALTLRRKDPDGYIERACISMAVHVEAMLALHKKARSPSITATTIRAQAQKPESKTRSRFQVLFLNTFVRCFAKDAVRFAGLH